jgi:hypothetical protein
VVVAAAVTTIKLFWLNIFFVPVIRYLIYCCHSNELKKQVLGIDPKKLSTDIYACLICVPACSIE